MGCAFENLGNEEIFKRYPSNMLMNELELSCRCNSGWHCKKMVSRFVLKLIYHNSWFRQFFDFKISIKSSINMGHVLSIGIVSTRNFAKTFYWFERNLDTTCWLIHVFCKKSKCSKRPKISHDGSSSKTKYIMKKTLGTI